MTTTAIKPVTRPKIRPRSDWGRDLPPVGRIRREESVRFLLIHHTATHRGAGTSRSRAALRECYRMHTRKGWPDIAYNVLVDSGGQIWEGRAGSIAGPVRGDATGGSQGYAILCCFIGDFTNQAPTPAAMRAMTKKLTWLACRHRIDMTPGRRVPFISRLEPLAEGTRVRTRPIAGHRDMTRTSCPGDRLYGQISTVLIPGVRAGLKPATGGAVRSDGGGAGALLAGAGAWLINRRRRVGGL